MVFSLGRPENLQVSRSVRLDENATAIARCAGCLADSVATGECHLMHRNKVCAIVAADYHTLDRPMMEQFMRAAPLALQGTL